MKLSGHFIVALMLSAIEIYSQSFVREVDHRLTQIDFGYHLLNVYFNVEPACDGFANNTAGFKHTEEDRKKYVAWLKEEIGNLPEHFVTRYLVDNIHFMAILPEGEMGYHTDDLIIIEGRKDLYQRRRIFFHETAHEVFKKNEYNPEFKEVINVLESYERGIALGNTSAPEVYASGFSTFYGNKNAQEDFCELFADLMVRHPNNPLTDYINQNPGTAIAKKCRAIISFFETDLRASSRVRKEGSLFSSMEGNSGY